MSSEINFTDIPQLRTESTGPALSPSQLIWRRFRKHRMAMAGIVGVILLLIFIIAGSVIVPETKANEVDLRARLGTPSELHWMGTDSTGRDVFNRIIYGGQISLLVGILAVSISVTLGTVMGGIAAYYGGWVDSILMRITESMLSIPSLFLLIVLGKYFGKEVQTINILGRSFSGSVGIVILVIGLTSWMYLARIVRANVLSLKEMDYIAASKSLGASNVRIFFYHLVPNTLGAIIVAATLGLASAILIEAYVSFLGLGIQPPTASWGNMLTGAQTFIQRGAWWMWVFPSLYIVFTILCINLMGDGLRDALDPHSTRHL
ncbi:MAG: ABC transporter permease [Anaerolineales bacterium]|nr:ABC transporter permease [Anaerolineales bacterium]MDO9348990.1 ABC transporter permease [Anaerolineales bacterium]